MRIYEQCTYEPYCFLVNETTISSNHVLCFSKNPVDEISSKEILLQI